MVAHVFLSYSSKDSKVARTICSALESRGLTCWIASRDVGPGENFMTAIVRAIRTAKVMVLVFSENANNSEEIKREIVLAGNYKLSVIPVRVEDVVPGDEFAYQFATRQWIDLFEDWEQQIERLAKWIASFNPPDAAAGATMERPEVRAEAPAPPAANSAAPGIDLQQQQAEAERRIAAEAERKQNEARAQRLAEEEQRAREQQNKQRADAERAFAAARRADSVSALDAFLAAHPTSDHAAEAKAMRAALAERDEAYSALTGSGDPAALRRFLDRYPEGKLSDDVRARLRRLEPKQPSPPVSRRTVVVGGAAVAAGAVAIAAVVASRDTSGPTAPEPGGPTQPEPGGPAQPQPSGPAQPPAPPSRLLHVLSGHTAPVEAAYFSHDGSRVLTRPDDYQPSNFLNKDTTARLWDTGSGAAAGTIPLDTGGSPVAVFSPDGKRVLSFMYFAGSGALRLWDGSDGAAVANLSGHSGELNMATFSSDSSRIATASDDKTARLWNGSTGELLTTLRGHSAPVERAYLNSKATLVVTVSKDGTVRLWDAQTGAPGAILKIFDPASVKNDWPDALLSPDGSLVLTRFSGGLARLWRTTNGALVATLTHTGDQFDLKYSPDGSRIVTADGNTGRLWDGTTGAPIATLSGHSGRVFTAGFNRDGSRILTIGQEDPSPRLWDGRSGAAVAALAGHTGSAFGSFSPDGAAVATESWGDKTTNLWEATNGAAIASLPNAGNAYWSPDSRRLLTTALSADPSVKAYDAKTGTAQLSDAKTGAVFATLSGHTAPITFAQFSPDGRLVVTASKDKTARIWNATIDG